MTRARLLALGLSERDVDVLMTIDADIDTEYDGTAKRGAVAYFDEVSQGRSPKAAVNWSAHTVPWLDMRLMLHFRITNELLGQLTLKYPSKNPFQANKVSVAQMSELVDLVSSKMVTGQYIYDDSVPRSEHS